MIPWVQLDTATVPGGGSLLRLMQRGNEFSIMAGAVTLMNSRIDLAAQHGLAADAEIHAGLLQKLGIFPVLGPVLGSSYSPARYVLDSRSIAGRLPVL